jgi:carbon monoxide dehydrogenase subunit G
VAIQGEYKIAASREQVWAALNDPAVLQACIPGCEELTKQSDTQIDAKITAQLGPIRSKFATQITLSDLNPPSGYTLSGEGKGVAGFGKGNANVSLIESEGGTLLRYDAQLSVGGKLAQVGSRLVETATRSYADQFFERFAGRLNAANAPESAPESAPVVPSDEIAGTASPAGAWRRWLLIAALFAGAAIWWVRR